MTSAIASYPLRLPLTLRLVAVAAVAVLTYVIELVWQVGAVLQGLGDALMRRPHTGDVVGSLGGILYWVALAAAAALAVAVLTRSRYLRLAAWIWLCGLCLMGILSWVAFGPDWPTPVAICGAFGVTLWLRRAERAA
jgi:hypothetical protein